ncbi:MAG: hypothetical protein LUG24_07390 [Clostridiales bacterium]|nr:hypothetical protein [Clostridiales bacterium]
MKKGFEIGLVYAGTVIGAGFASGRELWQFFGRFGSGGFAGLTAAFILYFILGYFMFSVIGKSREEKALDLFGSKGRAVMVLNLCFMFVLFVSMTAAAGAMAYEVLGLKREIGSLIFCLAVYFCVFEGKDGFLRANIVLTPFLILFGIACTAAVCPFWKAEQTAYYGGGIIGVLASGLIYVSYNILSLGAVMLPFKEAFKERSIRLWSSFSGSLMMFILGLCLFPLIVKYYKISEGAALPVLVIIKKLKGGLLYGIYGGVLFAAVLTTAAGNFFGFTESVFREKSENILKVLVLILGYVCSLMGFSRIISIIYPIFGFLGLLNILFIVYYAFKMKNKKI